LAIDFMRREASRSCRLAAAERFVEDGTVQNLVELEAKALFYRFCIALPKQDRTLLELHFEAELPPSSVARLLGISVNTFYARKSRMVKKLRKTFAAEYL
jgi:RNA polymerase sigma factor (sigma-70 family)